MVDKVDKKNIRKKELEKLEIPESGEDVCVWGGGVKTTMSYRGTSEGLQCH